MSSEPFIPALRFHALTPFYDQLNGLAAREALVHRTIADEFKLSDSDRLLDIGCGTGSLIQSLRKTNPNFEAVGLDVDPNILAMAKAKTDRNRCGKTSYIQASATQLPFENDHFDCIVSTLAFHHLLPKEKRQSLSEVYRVLKPKGTFILADWGKPSNALMRLAFVSVQILDGLRTTQENLEGKILGLVEAEGFDNQTILASFSSLVGTIEIIKATK